MSVLSGHFYCFFSIVAGGLLEISQVTLDTSGISFMIVVDTFS